MRSSDGRTFWLVDLGSANGTYHNGRRVIRPTALRDLDCVGVGDLTFTFRQLTGEQGTINSGDETISVMLEQTAWLLMADVERHTELYRKLGPAESAGRLRAWTERCQQVIETAQGQLGKYLGDGFLAYWLSPDPQQVAAGLQALHALRVRSELPFRVVVHRGPVTFGGRVVRGEEEMRGPEINFVFRLERLASERALTGCVSAAAHDELQSLVPMKPVELDHEIKGFAGRHRLYEITWPPATER